MEEGLIKVNYVQTKSNLSDWFTKNVNSETYNQHRKAFLIIYLSRRKGVKIPWRCAPRRKVPQRYVPLGNIQLEYLAPHEETRMYRTNELENVEYASNRNTNTNDRRAGTRTLLS